MLFNSLEFLYAFLPITLLAFAFARHRGSAREMLWVIVAASLVFYSYLNLRNLPLLLGSILCNYLVGERLKVRPGKGFLALGVGFNVGLLAYYKYTNFIMENVSSLFGWNLPNLEIVLPLGISFFTFTQIAFLVDSYHQKTRGNSIEEYAAFVTIFPHLIAGPILHHKHIIDQFRSPAFLAVSQKRFTAGLVLLLTGLVKKVAVADTLAPWVGNAFTHSAELTLLDAWAGALAYTFQLYYDFSGYTDMALGLGLMLNIRLPDNFNAPYQSRSITEFWRRWHITLSGFLKEYIYIPLGGNRRGRAMRYRNLLLTMLIGGIWHGAGWTFFVWGAGHGLLLALNRWTRELGIHLHRHLAWLATFICVVCLWVVFRATSLGQAGEVLSAMIGLNGCVLPQRYASFFGFMAGSGVRFADLSSLLPGGRYQVAFLALLLCAIPLKKEMLYARVFGSGDIAETGLDSASCRPAMAFLFGIAAFAVTKAIMTAEATEFLYFNF